MRSSPLLERLIHHRFGAMFTLAVVIVLAKAVAVGQGLHENFAAMGNDDIMRLVVVRDLVAGQGWFDTTQYRIVPPDGLSLHWSRYIDAPLAAIIMALSKIVPMDTAEQLTTVIWPTLIMLVTLGVVGFGTRRVFGQTPAVFAILCLVLWPLTADVHMLPGNLDHHNVQLLLSFILIFGVIWPSSSAASGVIAALAAALSLAVGLESLLFIVIAGLVLVVRAAHGQFSGIRQLVAFCVTLMVASVVLWLGQVGPSGRLAMRCDQLGIPILGLVAVATCASLLPLTFYERIPRAGFRLGLTASLTFIGIAMIWPTLDACFAGPYGNLSEQLQAHISSKIVEALPALTYSVSYPTPAIIFLLPPLAALILGGVYWTAAADDDMHQTALGILLVFCLAGVAVVFYQMRTVIMVAAVIPMIAGVVLTRMVNDYLATRDLTRGLGMLFAAAAFIAPGVYAQTLQPLLPKTTASATGEIAECRSYASLKSLNALPPAVLMTHANLGPSVIWATHHAASGAPYHRSAAALTNGMLVLGMPEQEMKAHIQATNATHLHLCANTDYANPFARDLSNGGGADWLERVPIADDHQLLFKVLR